MSTGDALKKVLLKNFTIFAGKQTPVLESLFNEVAPTIEL